MINEHQGTNFNVMVCTCHVSQSVEFVFMNNNEKGPRYVVTTFQNRGPNISCGFDMIPKRNCNENKNMISRKYRQA